MLVSRGNCTQTKHGILNQSRTPRANAMATCKAVTPCRATPNHGLTDRVGCLALRTDRCSPSARLSSRGRRAPVPSLHGHSNWETGRDNGAQRGLDREKRTTGEKFEPWRQRDLLVPSLWRQSFLFALLARESLVAGRCARFLASARRTHELVREAAPIPENVRIGCS